MNLPDISGLELAQAVKADAVLATIKLLMLTSQDVKSGNSTRAAGIEVCLNKPVRQNELATALGGLFGVSPVAAAEVPQPAATPSRTGRVLLAEDNAVNRAVASAIIKSNGYTLRIAENGLLALQAVAEERFDVVLMDCQMPEMDGYTATAAIRNREAQHPNGPRVPIIALTANTMQGDRDRCLAVGFDDYLAKPFKQKDLIAMIALWNTTGAAECSIADCAPTDTLVDGAAAVGKPQEAAALAPMAGNTLSGAPLDLSALEEIRSLDPSGSSVFLEEMIGLYLSDGAAQLKAIGQCIADVDPVGLRDGAHALKSASANVGATQFAGVCAQLEAIGRANTTIGASELLAVAEAEFERASIAFADVLRAGSVPALAESGNAMPSRRAAAG
jgi:two-component system sensor histidine kinase/response regulator